LRPFSFGGCGLALAALALMVFGAIECLQSYTNALAATVFFLRDVNKIRDAVCLAKTYKAR